MKNSVKDRSNAQSSCAAQFIANHIEVSVSPCLAAHHRTHHAAAAAVTKGVLGARQAVAPRRHRGARLGG